MPYSWTDLAGHTLARQFPQVAGLDAEAVAETVRRIGPIQSQTARSPFLALAARLPGASNDAISAAYEDSCLVRGSTLRGTVHTCVPEDHPLLEVATRTGQRALWQRTFKLARTSLEDLWHGIEEFARDQWRTPAELGEHLDSWLSTHDPGAKPAKDAQGWRYFCFGHGGLIRRPLSGGWHEQGAPGYRTAAAVLGDRTDRIADVDGSVDTLVLRHLAAHGPASRNDLSWWSGLGLRVVDASLARLAGELAADEGPDGRTYVDLLDAPGQVELPGVRLLPEFDALLCAYDPAARERFVDPGDYRQLWLPANGLMLAPLMVDGRLTGYWRLPGSGTSRPLEVTYFVGTRRPSRSELAEPVAALEAAYDVEVTRLSINRD